jgi:RHS repeat-associated protein
MGDGVEALYENYTEMAQHLYNLLMKFANCNPEPEQQTVTYIDIDHFLGGIEEQLTQNKPETNRFFYHPDHLGSSSFITDAAGEGYQHLQYLPFGETAVSQKLSWWSTPYQFTGKEKDDETGYNYFGARYYNSDVSIWLSVDPLSDKFPSITAYAYCFNKPIDHIDRFGLWGEKKAKRKHAQAVEKYGENRVSEIRWRENGKKKDYGFRIYDSSKEKEMDGQRTGNLICGTQVWDLGTKMYSDNDLRQYVEPLSGNAAGLDFYLTYEEAKYNYKHGNGRSAYVDLNKLNLSKIHASDFNHKKTYQGYPTLIVNLLGEHMANAEEGAVFGRITLVLIGENKVMALEDTYDFDIKGTPNRFFRDFATMHKKSQTGPGVPYSIIFLGTKEIQN